MADVAEILDFYGSIASCTAVRGNVDDTASMEELPEHAVSFFMGWIIFITHIADPSLRQAVSKTVLWSSRHSLAYGSVGPRAVSLW